MVIFGLDISRNNPGIDLARARAEGLEFCVARVSSARLVGDAVRDPQVDPLWPRFREKHAKVVSCFPPITASELARARRNKRRCIDVDAYQGSREDYRLLLHTGRWP